MEDDSGLLVEEVYVVNEGHSGLPQGWLVVDGEFHMDEVYLNREVKEKSLNVEPRAHMIQAGCAAMESYFRNSVWESQSWRLEKKNAWTSMLQWVLHCGDVRAAFIWVQASIDEFSRGCQLTVVHYFEYDMVARPLCGFSSPCTGWLMLLGSGGEKLIGDFVNFDGGDTR